MQEMCTGKGLLTPQSLCSFAANSGWMEIETNTDAQRVWIE